MGVDVRERGLLGGALSAAERAELDDVGFVMVRGAVPDAEVDRYAAELDRLHRAADREGTLRPNGSMHLLSAVAQSPLMADLLDRPATFRWVWGTLGWNVHLYHSHVDVHPPLPGPQPPHWHWHQDGGRQNVELETEPRPRMSIKVAYWFSDVSRPRRGNLMVIPGSHRRNSIEGPARRDVPHPPPADAVEVTADAGDAIVFDRRIWHARSDNHSAFVRRAVFLGYTYRWVHGRDDLDQVRASPWFAGLDDVRRQLLGGVGGDGDHQWGHDPDDVPLYRALREQGLLDRSVPVLR